MHAGCGLPWPSRGVPACPACRLPCLKQRSAVGRHPGLTNPTRSDQSLHRCRENNTGGFPRGLNQFLRALRNWLYGRDPLEPLQWEGPLEELKAALAEGEDVFGAL